MTTDRRRLRTPLALAVLSLLHERPMHPYEMRTLMRERGHHNVIRMGGGSIYDALERLAAGGLVAVAETSRKGKRPERTVYKITSAGVDELKAWVCELLAEPVAEFPQFAAALAFVMNLRKDAAITNLRRRTVAIEAAIAAQDAALRELSRTYRLPRIFSIESEYLQAMRHAELEFTKALVKELSSGRLHWPSEREARKAARQWEEAQGRV